MDVGGAGGAVWRAAASVVVAVAEEEEGRSWAGISAAVAAARVSTRGPGSGRDAAPASEPDSALPSAARQQWRLGQPLPAADAPRRSMRDCR